ncbi:MAG: 2-C-methyl-D-erythritol 4-phosphate cytidylyltransferase [Chloroflexi bacterium]|nr:2-C-methyl-D-erythritol 4-phosphate cytidylyltransferase [Chloroflexota bacterium]
MTNSGLAAIIVGGGRSSRMQGSDKLYVPLGGRPVIAVTVEVFESAAVVDTIVLVVAADRVVHCRKLAHERGWNKIKTVCAGGASRSHSVANGLHALQETPAAYVAVHDAARPFVTSELIARGLSAAQQHGAAVPGILCADTIRRVDEHDKARETLPRSALRAVQTPQVFARALLERAYAEQEANLDSFTDDAAVVESMGAPVHVVTGDYGNMKITTPTDLAFAQWLVQRSDGEA